MGTKAKYTNIDTCKKWQIIGLYPLTGQTTFLILSPWFESLELQLQNGNTLTITTTTVSNTSSGVSNGGSSNSSHGSSERGSSDGNSRDSTTNRYIQHLTINNQPWDKAWVTWADVFEKGGTMDFELGPEPVHWATGEVPPSPASGG